MKINRINKTIERARQEGRVAFIGLVPIDPQSMRKSREIADMMIASELDAVDGRTCAAACSTRSTECESYERTNF